MRVRGGEGEGEDEGENEGEVEDVIMRSESGESASGESG